MLIRTFDSVVGTECDVDWVNGTSRRLLVASDSRGYAVADTYVRAGTTTLLRYDNHLETCYCIEGEGEVHTAEATFTITVGTLYAPDRGEEHRLTSTHGMRLICVFNPALHGSENHKPEPGKPSGY